MDFSLNASPTPTTNVPDMTATLSSVGCQCGAMRYPSGNLARITNGMPAFDGSPSSTAICAPAGSDAGAGPHLISEGARATGFAMAGFAAVAGAVFFAVWAFGAAAVAMTAATAISVVRTIDIRHLLIEEVKDGANYSARLNAQGSR